MSNIKIKVSYAGRIADKLGRKAETLFFHEPVDVRTLMARIADSSQPDGEEMFFVKKGSARKPAVLTAVNGQVAGADVVLRDGDSVFFVQMVSGG